MKVIDKLARFLDPIAQFVNEQRYLLAIRDAFFVFFAPTMAASFLTLLNALVFTNETLNQYVNLQPLSDIAVKVYNGSFALMAVFMALFIAYNLALPKQDEEGQPPAVHAAVIALASYFAVLPIMSEVTVGENVESVSGVFTQALTGSGGMFLAIIVSMLSYKMYSTLTKNKKIRIHMPPEVPPAVSKSFNTLIPGVLVILFFAIFSYIVEASFNISVPEIINFIIQKPLVIFVQNPLGMLFVVFISNLLWVFGIHGSSILSPVTAPTLQIALDENIKAAQVGEAIPNIVTQQFIDSMNLMMPVALIITVIIFSTRKDYRAVSKLAAGPAIFNISEPVMFGMPVVFNPLLMIPYLLAPTINLSVAYVLTKIGLITPAYVAVPWTVPPILNSYLTTGGDYKAAIMAALLLILDVIIFAPFVIAANRALKDKL